MSTPIADFTVSNRWHKATLAVASGAMLGLAFPPSPFYSLAYVGLIPFLLLLETLNTTWQALRYSYLMLFVFHLITLYWNGGFTHGHDPWLMGSGTALLLVHPLFYWVPILLYVFVRKRMGLWAGLAAFIFFWIAYEYSHSLSEFSFPWLTLGNSQAYDIERIQIAEYTSAYGLTFLLLVFNSIGFVLIMSLATGKWNLRSQATIVSVIALLVIYFGPWVYGKATIAQYERNQQTTTLKVGIIQPNIDPWEKWGVGVASKWESYERQLRTYVRETTALAESSPDLIVWPETAIPFRILLAQNSSYWMTLRSQLDSLGIPVFTGLPFTVYYDSATAPLTANRIGSTSAFYEDFNSATLIVPHEPVSSVYKKIVLVPYGERIPYAESFRFLIELLKWNVGIGMWGKGKDTVVFTLPNRRIGATRFSALICYESVFPDFVRQFVKRGAEFLIIITNDSWWGNTSGAYQHASYASLRAVENRRWIIRAANGGISGLIDPIGRIHYETKLYTAASFTGEIKANSTSTFYSTYGDAFALLCLFCAAVFLIFTLLTGRHKQLP